MVRSLPIEEPARSAETASRKLVDSTELLGKIVTGLRGFTPQVVEDGRVELRAVESFEWQPERRAFSVLLDRPAASDSSNPTSEAKLEVTVGIKRGTTSELKRSCPCRAYEVTGECHHAWAALYHLYSELSTRTEKLELEILDEEEAPTGGAWSRRLATLDRILGSDSPSSTSGEASSTNERTTWRVKIRRGLTFDVEITPYEQKATSPGRWSRGCKLTWSRWSRSPDLWREPEDRAVAGTIRQSESADRFSGTSHLSTSIDAYDILEHLIAHPRVFDAENPETRLEVLAGELTVTLRLEDGGSIRLVPKVEGIELTQPGESRLYGRGVIVARRGSTEVFVASVDSTRRSLVEHLLDDQLSFPGEARDELLARLPALEALFPVDLPEALESKSVPADERIHVLLTPIGFGGVSLSIRFRPLPGGADWPPGEGLETHGRVIDQHWVTARRKLSRERRLASRFVERFELEHRDEDAGSPEHHDWTWPVENHEEALELLRRLQRKKDDDIVIEWPEGRAISVLPDKIGLGELRVQVEDKHDLFGLDGFVDVDDGRLALALLLERVRKGSRFVPVDGNRWAEISETLRARLKLLAEVARGKTDDLEVSRAAVCVVEDALEDCEVERCAEWERFATRLEHSDEITYPERNIDAELRSYQEDGFRWMCRLATWGVGACLADDMGLGKTVQTLAVLSTRSHLGPTLVIAPTSVTANWVRECGKFAPSLNPHLYRETNRRSLTPRFENGDLVVASYGLVRLDIDRLAKVDWGTVVLDEAQWIKNSRSQTSQSVARLRADWKLALTGTPIENHLGELWSLFRFLTPGLFGDWEDFRKRFAEPIEKHGDEDRQRILSQVTRPFILRRTKSEVLTELPSRTDVTLRARLSSGERALYEDARLAALASLASKSQQRDIRFEALAALTRLRQISCHPQMAHPDIDLPSAKLELFLELIENLRRGGHRALVFSQFTKFLGILREELRALDVPICYLDGGTPQKERMRQVDLFQEGHGDVFLISLKAGGTGLNLTAADYVIHMDPWWNPAIEDQATDRAHRFGQTRPVTVYRLVAENTIEEEIRKMQSTKRALIAGVLGDSDGALGVSTEEMVDLIRSAHAPVEED